MVASGIGAIYQDFPFERILGKPLGRISSGVRAGGWPVLVTVSV